MQEFRDTFQRLPYFASACYGCIKKLFALSVEGSSCAGTFRTVGLWGEERAVEGFAGACCGGAQGPPLVVRACVDQRGEVGGRRVGVCAPSGGAGPGWRFVDGGLGMRRCWVVGGGRVIVGVRLATTLSEYVMLVRS